MKIPMLSRARRIPTLRRAARGFSLVSAIFLLVVLAALGAAMVSVFTMQQSESALDARGAHAYQAARAGIEWGLYQQLQPVPAANCFADTSFALPAGLSPNPSTLNGFTVSVHCTLTVGPGSLQRRQIIATACNQPSSTSNTVLTCPNPSNNRDYVQRRLQVEF